MDGFTPEPTHYRLRFADGRLDGMTVTVRSVSIRRRIAFNKTRFTLPRTDEEAEQYIQDIYAEFIDRLVDWNLTYEDGTKVPKTVDGLMDQDEHVAQQLIKAWFEVIDAQPQQSDAPDPTVPDFDPEQIPMQTGYQPSDA